MKLDILVFAAHPDDAELGCAGTIIKHVEMGYKVGVVDLTKGELGTRGTIETREEEAKTAATLLGIHVRENLSMQDGFFENVLENQLKVIQAIRKYQPEIIIANAIEDRHPDHGRAARLISDSFFKSGLAKIETTWDGELQEAWRPKWIYHYIQDRYIKPDFVIDISDFMDRKIEAIKAFKTQFHDPESTEPDTYISSPHFIDSIIARAREYGKLIGKPFAEGFTTEKTVGVENLFHLK